MGLRWIFEPSKMIVLFGIIGSLSACSSAKPSSICSGCLPHDLVKYYIDAGDAGIGDAYLAIADNIEKTGRHDLGSQDLWISKALRAGSPQQSIFYAHNLIDMAKTRPKKSQVRNMLLNAAENYLKVAALNSAMPKVGELAKGKTAVRYLEQIDSDLVEISNLR